MNRHSIIRRSLAWVSLLLLSFFAGCNSAAKPTATYLGDSNELATLSTPTGFTITPAEADQIRVLRRGNSIAVHHLYYDNSCYYVCDGFFGSKDSYAITSGVRIDGKSGAVYNPETAQWDPRP